MKLKRAILAVLLGCFTFIFISCSKVSNAIPPSPTTSKFLKGADGPPLWIVDNVEKGYLDDNRGKLKISPKQIESITVLSPASTDNLVSRFGERGKNGVVLVTTKK
ncbi:hypothetical protein GK091_24290 [Spirosoma agri]|uniref:TonB-dependent receptor plug domain-containing protein n=1 Tax=Spirosoma agri TaxID=1987381 RepID=A0A6M0IPZ8_9BACT|nr:hypothetical protein [Spirosoma agri]NEU70022.1 hypothetical protein [Spirosoma agri]